MNLFDQLRYPIVQAPIGGASSVDLAIAVSEAGGMGSLPLTWTEPEQACQQVKALKAGTDEPFAVNFVLSFPPRSLTAALKAGAPVVTFSWGMSAAHVATSKAAGATVGIQVGSVDAAKRAVYLGADFLICQGLEAGGHVQSTTNLDELLPRVVGIANEVPVIAAGGLADADDVAWCLAQGATGVMLGTRFVATREAKAHPVYKKAIVDAGQHDTSYTWCFDGGWPYSGHRVIRNQTLEDWEAAGCPPPGNRPGEGDAVATMIKGGEIPRYHMASPVETTTGAVADMALYAGTGSDRIDSILSAKDVVETLCAKCDSACALPEDFAGRG